MSSRVASAGGPAAASVAAAGAAPARPDREASLVEAQRLRDAMEKARAEIVEISKQIDELMAERKRIWPFKDAEREKLRAILQEERAKAAERDELKKVFDEQDHRLQYLTTLAKQVVSRVQLMPIDVIHRRISEMETAISQCVLPINEEKRMVAEIARMKASIPMIEEYEDRMVVVNAERDRVNELYKPVKALEAVLYAIRERRRAQQEALKVYEDQDKAKEEAVDALRKKRDQLKERIDTLYKTLKQHRRAFDVAMREWAAEMKEYRRSEKARRISEAQESDRKLVNRLQRAWVLSGAGGFLAQPIDPVAVAVLAGLLRIPSYIVRRALLLVLPESAAAEADTAAAITEEESPTPGAGDGAPGAGEGTPAEGEAATGIATAAAAAAPAKPRLQRGPIARPEWMRKHFSTAATDVFAHSVRMRWPTADVPALRPVYVSGAPAEKAFRVQVELPSGEPVVGEGRFAYSAIASAAAEALSLLLKEEAVRVPALVKAPITEPMFGYLAARDGDWLRAQMTATGARVERHAEGF